MSFFREMSIQVLCSLFNWVVLCHWALGVLYMCWISASHLIHSCMICNYFSHYGGCLFTLLILSFDTKVFNCDESQLIFLVAYAFHVVSKIIAKSTSMKSFPCVFFKEFYSFSSNIYVCGSLAKAGLRPGDHLSLSNHHWATWFLQVDLVNVLRDWDLGSVV